MKVVSEMEAGMEENGMLVQDLAAYFYADGGLVMLPQPYMLQRSFEVLMDLFNWVGLRTNAQKKVIMDC